MIAYIIRRILYAVPILIGVNLITFALFFMVNSPDHMAQAQLGVKHITPEAIAQWKQERGYDKPLFVNTTKHSQGLLTDTIFFDKSLKLFVFDFGKTDEGRIIATEIKQRMWPSLSVALPAFFIGILLNIFFSLVVVMFRASMFELAAMVLCVAMFSISGMFYIIGGQYLFGKTWSLVPVSGYLYGIDAIKFIVLPVFIGVLGGVGGGTRLYRMIFLEEANKDYIRTARSKGVPE